MFMINKLKAQNTLLKQTKYSRLVILSFDEKHQESLRENDENIEAHNWTSDGNYII